MGDGKVYKDNYQNLYEWIGINMRKLASIQKVVDIQPIEGADKIECITVLGWKLVAKKDEFKIGDLCVYIEMDSLLPKDIAAFAFMEKYKFRVKTVKLRGQISQGLSIPFYAFSDNALLAPIAFCKEGTDVTEQLGVTKYEKEDELIEDICDVNSKSWYVPFMKYRLVRKLIIPFISKKPSGNFPKHIIAESDETRIQCIPKMFTEYANSFFTETEKIEGMSSSFCIEKKGGFFKKLEFSVSSRTQKKLHKDRSNWWKIAEQYNIETVLRELMASYPAKSWAIQGEIVGDKIQGNIYAVSGLDFYAFRLKKNQLDGSSVLFSPEEGQRILGTFGIKWVPIIGKIRLGDFTMDTILAHADGKSVLADTMREGSVFVLTSNPSISFKAVSNQYLLKKEKKQDGNKG